MQIGKNVIRNTNNRKNMNKMVQPIRKWNAKNIFYEIIAKAMPLSYLCFIQFSVLSIRGCFRFFFSYYQKDWYENLPTKWEWNFIWYESSTFIFCSNKKKQQQIKIASLKLLLFWVLKQIIDNKFFPKMISKISKNKHIPGWPKTKQIPIFKLEQSKNQT